MIDYFESLMPEEQEEVTDVIKKLYRQTFILEKKYDRRQGRLVYEPSYRTCYQHIEFIKAYFKVAGIELMENAHLGIIYIQGEPLYSEKLPKLATIYILILKLIYDEKMASSSSSNHIVTTLGEINGKAGEFRVLKNIPSPTEMKRTVTLLKKYQIVEPLDVMEDLNEYTRLIVYPCINAVLLGDDIRQLLGTFSEEDFSGESAGLQGDFEDMPE